MYFKSLVKQQKSIIITFSVLVYASARQTYTMHETNFLQDYANWEVNKYHHSYDSIKQFSIQPHPTYLSTPKISRVELCTELLLHLVTFLMFFILVHNIMCQAQKLHMSCALVRLSGVLSSLEQQNCGWLWMHPWKVHSSKIGHSFWNMCWNT